MKEDGLGDIAQSETWASPARRDGTPGWWDRQPIPLRSTQVSQVPIEVCRMNERVCEVERVASKECAKDARASIARDLAARMEWWTASKELRRIRIKQCRSRGLNSPWRDVGEGGLSLASGAFRGSVIEVVIGLLVMLVGVLVGVFAVFGGDGSSSVVKSDCLVKRVCPDCRYDLSALPDGVRPAELSGVKVGPARCPECGGAWPLVPPVVPEVEGGE
jgi:hypothetical protein